MSGEQAGTALSKSMLRHAKTDRDTFAQQPRRPITLVLDRVSQHYNLGALVRLCDAFLIDRLVVAGARLDLRNRKFVQASCGTARWVPVSIVGDARETVTQARAAGRRIIVVEQTSCGVKPETLAATFPVCLVLGSERDGVSPDIIATADTAVTIPMNGMANSINVATAAAIVLYTLSVLHDRTPA